MRKFGTFAIVALARLALAGAARTQQPVPAEDPPPAGRCSSGAAGFFPPGLARGGLTPAAPLVVSVSEQPCA
jgi:hypothetical protein